MKKVQVVSFAEKKNEQEVEEMNMTPLQRMLLAFQLMDLAVAISPAKKLTPFDDGSITWLDLKQRK